MKGKDAKIKRYRSKIEKNLLDSSFLKSLKREIK
jgi:hypothetical protein